MSLPQIDINFKQKASTAIQRSEKGVVCLVLQDTPNLVKYEFYSSLDDMTGLSAANQTLIKSCFLGMPKKIIVISAGASGTFTGAKTLVDSVKFNWLVCNISASQADVVAYAKTRKCKTVVYNATSPDDMHIVNFKNTAVLLADGTTTVTGQNYIIRLAGLLAGLPFTRSSTYYTLTDLTSVTPVATPANGDYYIINDEGIARVARGNNSLVTLGTNLTQSMQKITVVEAMDLIKEDITTEFKNNYVGKYKNNYDNQCLFRSAVNSYFKGLEQEEILDNGYDNAADIDIEAQRSAWLATGKTAAATWSDIQVKKNTFQSYLYMLASVKILDATEDLIFNVEMF